jgi:hypothetical protein
VHVNCRMRVRAEPLLENLYRSLYPPEIPSRALANPGMDADVADDVERIIGSNYAVTITGNAADDTFVGGLGPDDLFGLGVTTRSRGRAAAAGNRRDPWMTSRTCDSGPGDPSGFMIEIPLNGGFGSCPGLASAMDEPSGDHAGEIPAVSRR